MRSIWRSTVRMSIAVLLLPAALSVSQAFAQIHYAREMNTRQYRALDRNKTVVLLSLGILEEHGPYLPAYTDGYMTEREVADVADAMVAKGWQVLIFPTLPLGAGGANELARKYPFPGTFVVRAATLRAVLMDDVFELGEAGFRWIFLANGHGGPNHNRVLDQVCGFFNATYSGGHMIVLRGLPAAPGSGAQQELQGMLSKEARDEDAASGHAGIEETSAMLFMQPGLVDRDYVSASPFPARGLDSMPEVAARGNWPGYFGSPRFGNAAYGALAYKLRLASVVEQALRTLAGTAPPDARTPTSLRQIDTDALNRDQMIERKQQEFLKQKDVK
jgi:creatinine amidohydrolase/Fe(II)-dependent formamide hydrolase-like protein